MILYAVTMTFLVFWLFIKLMDKNDEILVLKNERDYYMKQTRDLNTKLYKKDKR